MTTTLDYCDTHEMYNCAHEVRGPAPDAKDIQRRVSRAIPPATDPTRTLEEAQDWLEKRVSAGATCPCCSQLAKIYRRQIYGTMASELIKMYRTSGMDWFHMATVVTRGGDSSKLTYWGLTEEDTSFRRSDGGRAGWWRVTPHGELFVKKEISIPKYAYVYDGRQLDLTGPLINIEDALGKKFNYGELMGAS